MSKILGNRGKENLPFNRKKPAPNGPAPPWAGSGPVGGEGKATGQKINK